jgi:hypothetical protein
MKTLIKFSTVLAGVLAAATSLADQSAMVVDSNAHFYTLRAIPAGLRQLSDDQLHKIEGGIHSSESRSLKSINATAGTINNKIKFLEGNVVRKPN